MMTFNATVIDSDGKIRIININEGAIDWLLKHFDVISIEEE